MTIPTKLLDELGALTGPQEQALNGCAREAFGAYRRGDLDKVEEIVDAYGLDAVRAGIPPAPEPEPEPATEPEPAVETPDGTPDAETAVAPKPKRTRARSTKPKR